MKKIISRSSVLVLFLLLTNAFSAGGWKLFWSDEFDSTALNDHYWNVQTAGPGWVNNEQQTYTAGHDRAGSNIYVANGNLNIFALNNGGVTSGRIYSQGKQSFQYGRMEARMRLPITQGYWPAFWMLGTQGGWPQQGEIDIMEGRGSAPNWTSGSFHSSQGTPVQTRGYTMPAALGNLHDSFHIYAIDWSKDSIRWFLDTVCFETLTVAAHPGIPLSNNFYFILNVAVGGNFGGNYNNTTVFPESLIVDYVRVYKWDPLVGVEPSAARAVPHGAALTNSAGRLSIVLPEEQRYSMEISSVNGRRVLASSGAAKSFAVATSTLAPGVYIVNVRGMSCTLTDRFVVRR